MLSIVTVLQANERAGILQENVVEKMVSFFATDVRSDGRLVRWYVPCVAYMQAMLRRSTFGRMTRSEEERMRSDNRRREDAIDEHKRMLAQDKLMRCVNGNVEVPEHWHSSACVECAMSP